MHKYLKLVIYVKKNNTFKRCLREATQPLTFAESKKNILVILMEHCR